jgi:hypothetical protein
MSRKNKSRENLKFISEDTRLNAFMEDIFPRWPMLKVYRLGPGGKQTFLCSADLETFSLGMLRDQYDGGKFLLRTIRSNGTYGPSRVVQVAPKREPYRND